MTEIKVNKILKLLSIVFIGLTVARLFLINLSIFGYILFILIIAVGTIISTVYIWFQRKGLRFSSPIIILIWIIGIGIVFKDDLFIFVSLVSLFTLNIIRYLISGIKTKAYLIKFTLFFSTLMFTFLFIQNIGSKLIITISEYFMYLGLLLIIVLFIFKRKNETELNEIKKQKKISDFFVVMIYFILLSYLYIFFIQDYIIDYKKERLIQMAQKHYFKNKAEFEELFKMSKEIGTIEEFTVLNDDLIEITIQDTTAKNDSLNYQTINIDNDFPILDIEFDDSSKIIIKTVDSTFVIKNNWKIRISSDNIPVFQKVITKYLNIDIELINNLRFRLHNIGCKTISKNRKGFEIRYWGNFCENLQYLLTDKPIKTEQNERNKVGLIKDNLYWYYQDCGLIDYTDSYYFYRFNI
jgi:hypothetical protein